MGLAAELDKGRSQERVDREREYLLTWDPDLYWAIQYQQGWAG